VNKNGEGIKNEAAHLMCYQAKPASGEPKHEKVLGIHVNNLSACLPERVRSQSGNAQAGQFGSEQVDTIKEDELCVPATKTLGGG